MYIHIKWADRLESVSSGGNTSTHMYAFEDWQNVAAQWEYLYLLHVLMQLYDQFINVYIWGVTVRGMNHPIPNDFVIVALQ